MGLLFFLTFEVVHAPYFKSYCTGYCQRCSVDCQDVFLTFTNAVRPQDWAGGWRILRIRCGLRVTDRLVDQDLGGAKSRTDADVGWE